MKSFSPFVTLIFTTVLGFILGLASLYVVSFIEARGSWEQLSQPPGEIARLVAADEDDVIVEMATGMTYEVSCRATDQYDPCFQPIAAPAEVRLYPCDEDEFPQPSVQVIDRLSACYRGEAEIILSQYELRQDGTLWRWTAAFYPYGQLLRFLQIMALSTTMGLAAGIIILARLK